MTPPLANDSVLLVVWYKNDVRAIFSYDLRGKNAEKAATWKDTEILGSDRAYFITISQPATLSISNIEEADEADYRCRVDFRKSPTRNYKVKLTVIVPPQKPNIFDDRGKEITVAGPYEEGSEMKLTCMVSGGRPTPVVRWWRGSTLLDSKDSSTSFPNVKHNKLVVSHLERSDLHAIYTCNASNNNISQPVSASISVEMHFKPLTATILSSFEPLTADRKYEVVCQAVGSRPPAKITWWKDNKQLEHYIEKTSEDGNVTVSTLTFTPSLLDHDKQLTCRADNPRVKAGFEEDTWKLSVYFLPVLQLDFGSKINPDDIEENDDVYFECKIHANPPAYKVVWKHNNQIVQHNQKNGVIVSNQALVLQGVKRSHAGNYTCIASNVEGDGESNTIQLRVMYKPVCRNDQKRVYGVARHESARVLCEVDAFPPPDDFRWMFNNSADVIDVPPERYHSSVQHSVSTLSYTPVTDMDYGTVMCWASNTPGKQEHPCVFHIIAAGHPDPPFNCSLMNQTTESLEIECIEGFDGGQPQSFQLEVYDLLTQTLKANKSSRLPAFNVDNLLPGRILKMVIYATNSKGKSDAVTIEGYTLKAAEKQTGTPVPFELTPLLVILIATVTLLVIASVVVAGTLRVRSQTRGTAPRPQALPIKDKATMPLRSDVQDLYDMDDKNPDLIPCNKDSDYQLVSSAGTPGAGNGVTTPSPQQLIPYDDPMTVSRDNIITRNGDIYDSYKNRYIMPHSNVNEVTYAELCLTRPTTLGDVGSCYRGAEPTVYAEIDHSRRQPLTSPATHREIVTVRTPLMANQQESCV